MSKYGLPYMGSKAKIVTLFDYIFDRHHDCEYFIDLFCGGAAVSHYALETTNFKIIANDIDRHIIALIDELINNHAANLKKILYDFVDRELFFDVTKYNPQNFPDWYVGFIRITYSFGNRGDTYLFGREIETGKRAIHQAIVFNDWTLLKTIAPGFDVSDEIKNMDYKTNRTKRLFFMKQFRLFIESSPDNAEIQGLAFMQQLQNLERLERLERIKQQDNRLTLTALDWRAALSAFDDKILSRAFIYCDIPYEDTGEYVNGGFDHRAFWAWFRAAEYPVYVSSYKAPADITPVNFTTKVQLFTTASRNVMNENIYWNGRGTFAPTLYDDLFNL